jgi:cyclase
MVKGKQFSQFRDTGDPISAARIYSAQKADEIVFINIDDCSQTLDHLIPLISRVSEECFMPLTVGGGIKTVSTIRDVIRAGADKVLINTAAIEDPDIILEATENFGSQSIVAGIDVRCIDGDYQIFTRRGTRRILIPLEEQIANLERAGAGEILINSIDQDGMMQGYDLRLLQRVRACAGRPVIALGGAGNFQHLNEVLKLGLANAVACASLFHFGDNNPIRARSFLKNEGIMVRDF